MKTAAIVIADAPVVEEGSAQASLRSPRLVTSKSTTKEDSPKREPRKRIDNSKFNWPPCAC